MRDGRDVREGRWLRQNVQAPGLSLWNAISNHPNAGNISVSLLGGLLSILIGLAVRYVPLPLARTKKSWPCKWIGCANVSTVSMTR